MLTPQEYVLNRRRSLEVGHDNLNVLNMQGLDAFVKRVKSDMSTSRIVSRMTAPMDRVQYLNQGGGVHPQQSTPTERMTLDLLIGNNTYSTTTTPQTGADLASNLKMMNILRGKARMPN
jgi:hypothetical protein